METNKRILVEHQLSRKLSSFHISADGIKTLCGRTIDGFGHASTYPCAYVSCRKCAEIDGWPRTDITDWEELSPKICEEITKFDKGDWEKWKDTIARNGKDKVE